MLAQACREEFVVGDGLQNLGGAQFGFSSFVGERKMVVFKSFDGAGWAGVSRWFTATVG